MPALPSSRTIFSKKRSVPRRRQSSGHLPEVYVELEPLPLTANLKANCRVLPEPEAGEKAEGFAPSAAEAERILARICDAVLEAPAVGCDHEWIHADIFSRAG